MDIKVQNLLGEFTGETVRVDPAKVDLFDAALQVFNYTQNADVNCTVADLVHQMRSGFRVASTIGFVGSYGQYINAAMFALLQCFDGHLDGDELTRFHAISTRADLVLFLDDMVLQALESGHAMQAVSPCAA
jgi:hypothetical protein